MPCWAIPAVVARSAVAAAKHVVAVVRRAPHVGRPARRLIRHHLGLGHSVAAHRTARAIWRTSVVCVPGAPLAAIFGPPTAGKVTSWLPISVPGTGAATGFVGQPAVAFAPAGDPYSGAPNGQSPVSVSEPGCVLVFGGAAVIAMTARRLRAGSTRDRHGDVRTPAIMH
jgi:hypothetical protein